MKVNGSHQDISQGNATVHLGKMSQSIHYIYLFIIYEATEVEATAINHQVFEEYRDGSHDFIQEHLRESDCVSLNSMQI